MWHTYKRHGRNKFRYQVVEPRARTIMTQPTWAALSTAQQLARADAKKFSRVFFPRMLFVTPIVETPWPYRSDEYLLFAYELVQGGDDVLDWFVKPMRGYNFESFGGACLGETATRRVANGDIDPVDAFLMTTFTAFTADNQAFAFTFGPRYVLREALFIR